MSSFWENTYLKAIKVIDRISKKTVETHSRFEENFPWPKPIDQLELLLSSIKIELDEAMSEITFAFELRSADLLTLIRRPIRTHGMRSNQSQ